MSAPNTTPGPWSVGRTNGGLCINFGGRVTNFVARIIAGRTIAEGRANAHLIAASPELYEALEILTAHVETCRKAFPNDPVSAGKVCRDALSFSDFERAFEVLRKARGEA